MSGSSLAAKLIALHRRVVRLKTSPRRGWVRRGVPDPESIAEHSFGTALLALVAARELGLSAERAVIMALVHELCEAVVGDIIPADGVATEEKRRREEAATREVLADVDDTGELVELWLDFEHGRTPEGALVKQLDKIEMALQASDYEHRAGLDPDEFLSSARRQVDRVELLDLLDVLRGPS